MRTLSFSLIITLLCFMPTAQAVEYLRESVAQDYDKNLEEMFLHFHRNPELSNLESETAKRMAAEIRALGWGQDLVSGSGVELCVRSTRKVIEKVQKI